MQSKPTQVHGPYIVTTKRPDCDCEHGHTGIGCPVHGETAPDPSLPRVERLAVATLEEAQAEQDRLLAEQGVRGGFLSPSFERVTLGPLPDGTVIEVEPAPGQQQMRRDLREWGVSMDTRDALDETIAFAWVTAYNAAQAEGLMT